VALRHYGFSAHAVSVLLDDGLEILGEDECRRLVAGVTFGRVGVTMGALPAIFPVNYAVVDGQIVFRTGEGTKLRAALDRAVVAFEVDHPGTDAQRGWSVLIVGMARELDVANYGASAHLLVGASPVASRDHLVQIRPEFISGRRVARCV